MFWLHPMNIQAVNAQHRNGLVAAEGCAWGRETLKRCKKRSSLSPSSATHPLCSEIMNVPACGVPHSTTAHALALEGPGEAPRLSPRTMLNVLLLCCGLLQGIHAILTTDLSCGHLQKVSGGLEGADRARYSGLLRKVKEVSAEPVGALPRLGLEQMALEVPEADGELVQRGSTLEPQQSSSTELQAAGREERSPRRCVRLLESCLGHQVPCCDPCATCYCRFFNAFCYCRKISSSFPCGKN
ncbi:agouti-related protein isoform X1 [Accipiter gentilis]|uniref:agouti-related protein isoform X1 n=1 Tax=Astur gentilis TaxID=8957 RepID=UPI00211056A5|nr:agouti-related protein isoform X1 [Accipiter gentilis]XP_049660266.1 agouti-related protein isoform X1 [Accipiter gentilis]